MSTYPTRKQYVGAAQRPAASFRVSPLQTATFRTDNYGIPAVSSGQTALVFRADIAGRDHAVRVFTTEARSGQFRYRSLADYLCTHPSPSIATATWIDNAIEVNAHTYPLVLMEWVEGVSLSAAVKAHLGNGPQLERLASEWRTQIAELRASRIAHGDLQHGNIIVDPSMKFRFIDLDGVWIPPVAHEPPGEFGQPDYQHPDRTSGQIWGEHIDWFSALVIYVSLRALAVDQSLWRHHHGDNLIFQRADYRGDSQVWDDLAASPDGEVAQLARILAESCDSDPLAATDLETILHAGGVPNSQATVTPPQTPNTTVNATATSAGTTDGSNWWVSTTSEVAAPAPGSPAPTPAAPARATEDANAWWVEAESTPSPPKAPSGQRSAPRQRAESPKSEVRSEWGEQSTGSYRSGQSAPSPPPPRNPGPSSPPQPSQGSEWSPPPQQTPSGPRPNAYADEPTADQGDDAYADEFAGLAALPLAAIVILNVTGVSFAPAASLVLIVIAFLLLIAHWLAR